MGMFQSLEAQLPIYWVPILKSLYNCILSVTQGPTTWVPGLIGNDFPGVVFPGVEALYLRKLQTCEP